MFGCLHSIIFQTSIMREQETLCMSYLKSHKISFYNFPLFDQNILFCLFIAYKYFPDSFLNFNNFFFLINLMQELDTNTLYMVYFNCRGTGHYYRYTLFEIGIPFQQIHLSINGQIPECLKKYNINLSDIPCIINEGKVIKDLYPTLRYLCKKFQREDLLGSTLQEQVKISEIFCKNSKRKSLAITLFLNYVPKLKKNPQEIKKIKSQMMQEMRQSPGCSQACGLLYSQTSGFLFNHLTIADFLFYENCYYFSGFFGDVFRRKMPIFIAYKTFFQKTEFYLKNKERIEGLEFIVPEFDESINEGFKLMWKPKKNFGYV